MDFGCTINVLASASIVTAFDESTRSRSSTARPRVTVPRFFEGRTEGPLECSAGSSVIRLVRRIGFVEFGDAHGDEFVESETRLPALAKAGISEVVPRILDQDDQAFGVESMLPRRFTRHP
jgi:hypothetical protein